MEFKAIAQQTAEEILAYSQDISGWKVVKSSKSIIVSKKTSKLFLGNLYRIEGIIPVSTAKLSNFLYQPESRIKWDKLLKAYNVLHKIDSDTFICHTITNSFAMGSISPRDFIDVIYIKHYEGNVDIICAHSVDFPGYPPTSYYVRGYNYPSGYVCSPLKENPAYSKLVVFVQIDMRGKWLTSIIEKIMPSNLVSFFLNAKDGIKAYETPSARRRHSRHPSVHKKK
ncbi:stAR-related lipid transfer protein 6 isoform X2 [Peromyscus californicus insignis]|uniref:stAR-related lipid transfer protein 6 isoform X2 n=1 Tax=Peromyscus californicus insignis TaxID=564181 RepID=UPI0022A7C6EF|nr:stAR-related lipid transfer protein 6 isoform X2 [Peromyscus californicus insignis]